MAGGFIEGDLFQSFFLKCISTVFTAMRYSHVESAEFPLNVDSFRNTCKERILGEVFGLRRIVGHAHANGVHPRLVSMK